MGRDSKGVKDGLKLYIMEFCIFSRLRSNMGLINAINMEELLRIFK